MAGARRRKRPEPQSWASFDAAAKALAAAHDVDLETVPYGPGAVQIVWVARNGEPGSGRRALTEIAALADEGGVEIVLVALGGAEGLVNLYESLGFLAFEGERDAEEGNDLPMYRVPGAPVAEIGGPVQAM